MVELYYIAPVPLQVQSNMRFGVMNIKKTLVTYLIFMVCSA